VLIIKYRYFVFSYTGINRTILAFVVFTIAFIATPFDEPVDKDGKIDFIGLYLGIGALFLFNFVWK
jgi:hypothetical protein